MNDRAVHSALPLPLLEGVAGEVQEVIGRDATIRLIVAMRGKTGRSWRVCFYVPKHLPIDHELVGILGWRDARRLSRWFGGEILQTSNLRFVERRWRGFAVWKLALVDQVPASSIAEWLGVDVTTVRKTLLRKPPEEFHSLLADVGWEGVLDV